MDFAAFVKASVGALLIRHGDPIPFLSRQGVLSQSREASRYSPCNMDKILRVHCRANRRVRQNDPSRAPYDHFSL